jgi:hypothetical protein
MFHQIQLVVDLEWGNASCQPMVARRHLHEIGSDRRMSHELTPKDLGPVWKAPRGFNPIRSSKIKCRISAMKSHKAASTSEPRTNLMLSLLGWPHIAGVADDEIARKRPI